MNLQAMLEPLANAGIAGNSDFNGYIRPREEWKMYSIDFPVKSPNYKLTRYQLYRCSSFLEHQPKCTTRICCPIRPTKADQNPNVSEWAVCHPDAVEDL